ncbi:MAG: hypothetical protein U0840_20240 [Gemmataceae bacterium]
MKKNQTRTLALENLEDRLAPAINAFVSPSGLLSIRGFSSTGLLLLGTTANPGEISISDGSNTTTSTGVQSINVALSGSPTFQFVTLDLTTIPNVINGNVSIDAGTAPNNIIIIQGVPDNTLDIMGNVTLSRATAISLSGDVAGNVTMTNAAYPSLTNLYGLTGRTLGNLTITGSIYSDGVSLTNSNVSGSARINLGPAGFPLTTNSATLDSGTIVQGSLTIAGGAGTNSVALAGTVNGFATITLGNGQNTIDFPAPAQVGKSLSISLGRGIVAGNSIGIGGTSFDGTVNGNLTISTAGGLNQIALGATVHGAQTTIAMGRGNNTLQFVTGLDITSGRMLVNMIRGGTNVFDPNGVAVTWPFRIYF